jgi:hypothetical protein
VFAEHEGLTIVFLFIDTTLTHASIKNATLCFRWKAPQDFTKREEDVSFLYSLASKFKEKNKTMTIKDMAQEHLPKYFEWPEKYFAIDGVPVDHPSTWGNIFNKNCTAISEMFLSSPVKARSFIDLTGDDDVDYSPSKKLKL